METYYLVDYENVGSGGVSKCAGLTENDHLVIFYTDNAKKIDLDIINNHGTAALETQKVPAKSQSVDMHIVSYMGYLIGKSEKKELRIVIVSKDRDYDNLIKYWGDKATLERKPKIDIPTVKKAPAEKKASAAKKTSTEKKASAEKKTPTEKKGSAEKKTPEKKKAPTKTQLNSDIQKILSKNGYEQDAISGIAKLVGKRYGKENFKQEVHNELGKAYTDYEEIYKLIKSVLEKYSG